MIFLLFLFQRHLCHRSVGRGDVFALLSFRVRRGVDVCIRTARISSVFVGRRRSSVSGYHRIGYRTVRIPNIRPGSCKRVTCDFYFRRRPSVKKSEANAVLLGRCFDSSLRSHSALETRYRWNDVCDPVPAEKRGYALSVFRYAGTHRWTGFSELCSVRWL